AQSLLPTALDAALLALALGGVAPLLAHPRALALLAVWAAGNAALAVARPLAGHDATAVDPAASVGMLAPFVLPLGAAPLAGCGGGDPDGGVVMLALFVLRLVAAPLAAWGERAGVWRFPWPAAFGWIGVALTAAGLALRLAAMRRLGARFSPRVALQREHALE